MASTSIRIAFDADALKSALEHALDLVVEASKQGIGLVEPTGELVRIHVDRGAAAAGELAVRLEPGHGLLGFLRSVERAGCQLELSAHEIAASHENKLAEQLDCLERGALEIKTSATEFAAPEDRHLTASEHEDGAVEYAIVEGRIVDPNTLLPIRFSSDHAHEGFSFRPPADADRRMAGEDVASRRMSGVMSSSILPDGGDDHRESRTTFPAVQ